MAARALEDLIQLLAKLPGLGPRSARRAALHLLKQRETLMQRLAVTLATAAREVRQCPVCGNLDAAEPCWICADPERDGGLICVVEEVDDLWALERSGLFKGRYHVLGGALSALDGRGPEDLGIDRLLRRIEREPGRRGDPRDQRHGRRPDDRALHRRAPGARSGPAVTRLAHGVPIGGELNYLDDGTLGAALKARRPVRDGAADRA